VYGQKYIFRWYKKQVPYKGTKSTTADRNGETENKRTKGQHITQTTNTGSHHCQSRSTPRQMPTSMFCSKLQTWRLMELQEAVDWSALCLDYKEWAWRDGMLAQQYLIDATTGETGQWNTTSGILDFVQEDDVLDLIVGGTDGKVYLLHNIQAYADTGALQITGIIGQSFSSKYKQITGVHSLFDFVVQHMPLNGARKYANQRWINHELTMVQLSGGEGRTLANV
jgi:hypothetical protein